jgi:hypothetical protein
LTGGRQKEKGESDGIALALKKLPTEFVLPKMPENFDFATSC